MHLDHLCKIFFHFCYTHFFTWSRYLYWQCVTTLPSSIQLFSKMKKTHPSLITQHQHPIRILVSFKQLTSCVTSSSVILQKQNKQNMYCIKNLICLILIDQKLTTLLLFSKLVRPYFLRGSKDNIHYSLHYKPLNILCKPGIWFDWEAVHQR